MSAGKLIPALLEETKDPDSALISAWREVPAVKLLSSSVDVLIKTGVELSKVAGQVRKAGQRSPKGEREKLLAAAKAIQEHGTRVLMAGFGVSTAAERMKAAVPKPRVAKCGPELQAGRLALRRKR